MKKITGELKSHYQRNVPFVNGNWLQGEMTISTRREWDKFGATVNRVRASEGYLVNTFRDLINYSKVQKKAQFSFPELDTSEGVILGQFKFLRTSLKI